MIRIELNGNQIEKIDKLTILLGNFDGVHLGHQTLIFEAKKRTSGPIGVVVFSDNPAKYIGSGKSQKCLTGFERKLRLFEERGIEYGFILKAEPSLFALSPEEFMHKYIDAISPSLIVVGEDYRFGKMAKGNPETLRTRYEVVTVPLLMMDEHKIGTKEIIESLESGDISLANKMLGYPYEISGKVIEGRHLGRTIGYPTANIDYSDDAVLPKVGVYLGLAFWRGIPYKAMISVGHNPTAGRLEKPSLEAYLLGANGSFYGETVYLDFLSFRREEKNFSSLEGLKKQLDEDKQALIDYSLER